MTPTWFELVFVVMYRGWEPIDRSHMIIAWCTDVPPATSVGFRDYRKREGLLRYRGEIQMILYDFFIVDILFLPPFVVINRTDQCQGGTGVFCVLP